MAGSGPSAAGPCRRLCWRSLGCRRRPTCREEGLLNGSEIQTCPGHEETASGRTSGSGLEEWIGSESGTCRNLEQKGGVTRWLYTFSKMQISGWVWRCQAMWMVADRVNIMRSQILHTK